MRETNASRPKTVLLRGVALLITPLVLAYVLFNRPTTLRSWDLGLDIMASTIGAGVLVVIILRGFKQLQFAWLIGVVLAHFVLSRQLNLLVSSWTEQFEIQILRTITIIIAADLGLFAALVFFVPVPEHEHTSTFESHQKILRGFPRAMIGLTCALILAIPIRFGFLDSIPSQAAAAAVQVTTHFVVIALWLVLAVRVWLPQYFHSIDSDARIAS